MNPNRALILWVLMVVLASCTTTIFRLPGGGFVVQVVGYPAVVPHMTTTPTPLPTATEIPDITPTYEIGTTPTITPTWSTCEVGNYYVIVQVDNLAIRQLTTSNTDNPTGQSVLRRVNTGTVLEVDSCLLETTPGGWLPIMTDDGLQGIVHSGYVRVSNLHP